MKRYLILSLVILLLIAGLTAVVVWQLRFVEQPLQLSKPVIFTVSAGSTRAEISDKLYTQKLIAQPARLLWLLRLRPQLAHFKAGTYRLMPGMNVGDLLALFNSGKEAQFPLKITEGSRLSDLLQQLANAPYIHRRLANDDYVTVAKVLNVPVTQLEGSFWPDTWFYTANTTDVMLLQRIYRRMDQTLQTVWAQRASNLPYKDPYQMLIMASIIEKETGRSAERPVIASVFINRLRIGMRLQTDPSVIYGMGERYQGKISREDLQTPTRYNTYLISGLPPTAIAIPGLASLKAAANPAQTDYLYFVANGAGGHTFSKTLAEHNMAVRRYLKGLKQKND